MKRKGPGPVTTNKIHARAILIEMEMTLARAKQDETRYGEWRRDYERDLAELRAKLDAVAPREPASASHQTVQTLCAHARRLVGASFARVAPNIGNDVMQAIMDVEAAFHIKSEPAEP